jgi:hypothetical protein
MIVESSYLRLPLVVILASSIFHSVRIAFAQQLQHSPRNHPPPVLTATVVPFLTAIST